MLVLRKLMDPTARTLPAIHTRAGGNCSFMLRLCTEMCLQRYTKKDAKIFMTVLHNTLLILCQALLFSQ